MAAAADPSVLVISEILIGLFHDFPQLRLFKDHAIKAVALMWTRHNELGYDDEEFFSEALSIRGRISIAGATLGMIGGGCCGCDDAAIEAGKRRLSV